MSLRPVKETIRTKSTIEGAGVKLQRAFGLGKQRSSIPFCCWMTSATTTRPITWLGSRGTHTVE